MFVNRPGTGTFEEQLEKLNAVYEYTLFDDDIHTGSTMRFAKALIENGREWRIPRFWIAEISL